LYNFNFVFIVFQTERHNLDVENVSLGRPRREGGRAGGRGGGDVAEQSWRYFRLQRGRRRRRSRGPRRLHHLGLRTLWARGVRRVRRGEWYGTLHGSQHADRCVTLHYWLSRLYIRRWVRLLWVPIIFY